MSSCRAAAWLPRIRGDRPSDGALDVVGGEAPPHPRGSTLAALLRHGIRRGSPASAGIDPSTAPTTPSRSGLPRIRGDRPQLRSDSSRSRMAPPHPRGSTAMAEIGGAGVAGSPASAGIDPRRSRPRQTVMRLPRIRGDRPSSGGTSAVNWPAPPHPRGSTPAHHGAGEIAGGSPASAGIDPLPS